MNAYLDNNVVSSIVRDDNASQSKALNTLLVAHDEGRVSLVTSELTLDEIKKCPPEHRTPLERTFRLLEKVPVAQSHALLYINSHGTARTWINLLTPQCSRTTHCSMPSLHLGLSESMQNISIRRPNRVATPS